MALSNSPYGPQRRRREPAIDRKAHRALLREIAKLIGQPVDSLAVKLVTLARLKMDSIEAQLLAGDPSVTIQDITTLREVFAAHVPKPSMQITVRYADAADAAPPDHAAVDGLVECRRCHWRPADKDRVSRCYACGWTHGADFDSPRTPLIAPPASTPAPSPENATAVTPVAHNVVPIDKAERSAQLRQQARISNNTDPGPARIPSPCIGSPFLGGGGDNRSISQFQRDIDNAYRGY